MIHREGTATILITVVFITILNILVRIFELPDIIHWITIVISVVLLYIVLQFFRNPSRKTPVNPDHLISPADGKVVVIEETNEDEYLKDKRLQVSIFMSPFNVHVNRYPVAGRIDYYKYHPGKYLVAWHPKSSTENERTTVVVNRNNSGSKVLFRQIAGALARRIVFYGKEGEEVKQGSECGFIKFGSRVDIFLPLGTPLNVKLGDVVTGGETVIARF